MRCLVDSHGCRRRGPARFLWCGLLVILATSVTSCFDESQDEAGRGHYYQAVEIIEETLGFQADTPEFWGKEIFVIRSLEEGGFFERAGFTLGDVLWCDVAAFYNDLVAFRGREVTLEVTRNGKMAAEIFPHIRPEGGLYGVPVILRFKIPDFSMEPGYVDALHKATIRRWKFPWSLVFTETREKCFGRDQRRKN